MLGKRLKELRESKGLTQQELAKIMNLSQQTIGHYEVERAKPDADTLKLFADFYSTTVDYLLGRTDIRNPADEIAEAVKTDPELADFWSMLREREDLKILFKQTKKLSPKEIQQVIRIIKAIEDEEDNK